MGKSQQIGMFLMIGAAIQMLIMLIGTLRRSYLTLALPVVTGVGVICALAFWVGWTMMSTDADLAELEEQEAVPAVA